MKIQQYLIFCYLTFMSMLLLGQNDSLNKYNSKGKKTGYWKIFLDQNAMPTDSCHSFFFGYEYYDNGKTTFFTFTKSSVKKQRFVFNGIMPSKGNPILIDGVMKIYKTKNDTIDYILSENSYKNGYPQTYIEFFFGKEPHQIFDFTKQYKNLQGSYFMTDYYSHFIATEEKKQTSYWWYTKVDDKWKFIKAESPLEK